MSSQPNKDLGQHWLDDDASLQAVADAAQVTNTDTVLEIGPGPGTLTSVLVERAQHVIALEIDPELARALPEKVPAANLTVLEGDIRHADFRDLPDGYKVAGNIPYYLTSHIIQLLLEAQPQPAAIGLLVQKEVAERIAARPGDMSVLSVTTQALADVKLGPVVAKELFYPIPKVNSQVISITPKLSSDSQQNINEIFRIVKAGFSERRKKLSNSLAGGLDISKQQSIQIIERAQLDPNSRAQELSVQQWGILHQAYTEIVN